MYDPMKAVVGRALVFTGVAIILAIPLWFAMQSLRDDRLYAAVELGEVDSVSLKPRPFQLESVRRAALQMLYVEPYEPATIEQFLRYALKFRPLYGPNWLDLAELMQREGKVDVSRASLTSAANLMPTQGEMQWRVAMLSAALGENAIALQALGRFTSSQPQNTLVAYSIANRLVDDGDDVIESLLPDEDSPLVLRKSVATRLLRSGLDTENLDLVKLVWSQSEEIRQDREWTRGLASRVFSVGDTPFLHEVWKSVIGEERSPGHIRNGGFEQDMVGHVFGWTTSEVEGAKISIDKDERFNGRLALRIEFDGSVNINFNHVRQVVPIAQSGVYEVKGYWKGNEVTTRTGIYVEVSADVDEERVVARTKSQFGSWDWGPFKVQVQVPEGTQHLQIRFRRRPTDRLDKLQSGSVWFDELTLVRVGDIPEAVSGGSAIPNR